MRIERVSVKDVLRYRDQVSLNFLDLPSGLIAFCGRNGEGKSTMLEAPIAAFYRQFPSRPERPLIDYCSSTDGFIEVAFTMEGVGAHVARIALDGPHRKSDAVLTHVLPDGSTVFLNDGKLTTYDAAIARLLPPEALILASVFAAQTRRGAFSGLDRKGRAELFAALLGLDQIIEWGTRAKSAAGLLQIEIDKLTARRDGLSRGADAQVEEDLERRAQQVQASGGQLEVDKRQLAHEIRNIEQRLALVADAAAQHAVATARAAQIAADDQSRQAEQSRAVEELEDVSVVLAADVRTATAEHERRLTALDSDIANQAFYQAELTKAGAELTAALADVETRIASNKQVLGEEQAILAAVETLVALDAELRTVRVNLDQAGDEATTLLSWERAQREGLRVIVDAETALAQVQKALDVPCGATEAFASCQFLKDAAALRDKVTGLEALIAKRPEAEAALAEAANGIAMNAAAITEYRTAIYKAEQARPPIAALAAKKAHLDVAKEKIAGHEARGTAAVDAHARAIAEAADRQARRVTDLQTRRTERQTEHTERLAALERRAADRRALLGATITRLAETLCALDDEAATVRQTIATTATASASAAAEQALLAQTRTQYEACLTSLARVEGERQELARRVAEARAVQEDIARLDSQIAALRTDLIEWGVLAKALGRDGLPVLEIDAAGPTVSAYANELLQASYGSRFVVDLVTQVLRTSKGKDGETHKDAFEIHVYDADRGGAKRDLDDLSGGEKVIVEECLRSAIALLVNQRSPIPLRTLWRDECTGALDVDNGPRYIAMLRRLQELGGYHQIVAIIHNPEWAALCDAQVHFAGGAVSIEMPPFGRSEAAA